MLGRVLTLQQLQDMLRLLVPLSRKVAKVIELELDFLGVEVSKLQINTEFSINN